jgi:hypothetical protein
LEAFDIRKEALLVRLSVGQVGVSVGSRTLAKEAAEKHGADADVFRTLIQRLLPEQRATVQATYSAARKILETYTLPWDDKAYRLCPAAKYPLLRAKLDEQRTKFQDAVQGLVENYDQLARDYARHHFPASVISNPASAST